MKNHTAFTLRLSLFVFGLGLTLTSTPACATLEEEVVTLIQSPTRSDRSTWQAISRKLKNSPKPLEFSTIHNIFETIRGVVDEPMTNERIESCPKQYFGLEDTLTHLLQAAPYDSHLQARIALTRAQYQSARAYCMMVAPSSDPTDPSGLNQFWSGHQIVVHFSKFTRNQTSHLKDHLRLLQIETIERTLRVVDSNEYRKRYGTEIVELKTILLLGFLCELKAQKAGFSDVRAAISGNGGQTFIPEIKAHLIRLSETYTNHIKSNPRFTHFWADEVIWKAKKWIFTGETGEAEFLNWFVRSLALNTVPELKDPPLPEAWLIMSIELISKAGAIGAMLEYTARAIGLLVKSLNSFKDNITLPMSSTQADETVRLKFKEFYEIRMKILGAWHSLHEESPDEDIKYLAQLGTVEFLQQYGSALLDLNKILTTVTFDNEPETRGFIQERQCLILKELEDVKFKGNELQNEIAYDHDSRFRRALARINDLNHSRWPWIKSLLANWTAKANTIREIPDPFDFDTLILRPGRHTPRPRSVQVFDGCTNPDW